MSLDINAIGWIEKINKLEADNHSIKRDFLAKCYNSKIQENVSLHPNLNQCSSTIRVNKYYEGDYLGLHCDSPFSDNSTHVVVVYLNDDYTGGELNLFDDKMQLLERLKPKANTAIIFPISFYHSTSPVTSGVKYCFSIQISPSIIRVNIVKYFFLICRSVASLDAV